MMNTILFILSIPSTLWLRVRNKMRELFAIMMLACCFVGCAPKPMPVTPARLYYQHRYPDARDALRERAADRNSKDVILDNLMLGMAALADGDLYEADAALMRAYEYLAGGSINPDDRKVAATLLTEDIKVWTGDPFEQAMSFYYVATLSMLRGEWDNARAAIRNSLFTLNDIGEESSDQPPTMGEVVRDLAAKDTDPAQAARPVESDFALGYLMAGLTETQLGRDHEAKLHYDKVRALNADLAPLADALAAKQYNTILLVDYGRGPIKTAYGPDGALVKYVPNGRKHRPPVITVHVNGNERTVPVNAPAVDLWTLSQYPKWWSLKSIRQAKSAVGNVLLLGGTVATGVGVAADSDETALAGLGAMGAGLLAKGMAGADTRQLITLPHCVYIVPLMLEPGRHDVRLSFSDDRLATAIWHDLVGGSAKQPVVYYLRQHAEAPGMPRWFDQPQYYNIHTERPTGLRPYLLGGRDLAVPALAVAAEYRRDPALDHLTLDELLALCRVEGIVLKPGPQGRTGQAGRASENYRHVTDGGRVLWSPRPGTHGHQRLTRRRHAPYQAVSSHLRDVATRLDPQSTASSRAEPLE